MEKEKGISLIITFFIMVIILAIVLAISSLLYSELKIIKNIGNSVVSFYAAESGVEKVLYYDRQVILDTSKRGLCSMYFYDITNNPNACPDIIKDTDLGLDESLYCNNQLAPELLDPLAYPKGCDPAECSSCKISFSTTFDNRNYYTTATISPDADGKSSILEIKSKGTYAETSRQIDILSAKVKPADAIVVTRMCADPISTSRGQAIRISGDINAAVVGAIISTVTAQVQDSPGHTISSGNVTLTLESGTYTQGTWSQNWLSNGVSLQSYYVNVDIKDSVGSEKTLNNIQPCNLQ